MARRSKADAGERRTSFLGVQLTPTERAILEQRAQTTGLSLSEFARIVLLSDLKAPAPSARDPQAIRALAVEITRVGNNVNQLAKIANETRALPHERRTRPTDSTADGTLALLWYRIYLTLRVGAKGRERRKRSNQEAGVNAA